MLLWIFCSGAYKIDFTIGTVTNCFVCPSLKKTITVSKYHYTDYKTLSKLPVELFLANKEKTYVSENFIDKITEECQMQKGEHNKKQVTELNLILPYFKGFSQKISSQEQKAL